MKVTIWKSGMEGGKTAYCVEAGEYGRKRAVATIRFIDKHTIARSTYQRGESEHWALMHGSGRIDRFDTLDEAKDEARKAYGSPVPVRDFSGDLMKMGIRFQ